MPERRPAGVGNDVKIGGTRVGAVTAIKPKSSTTARDRGAGADAGQGRGAAAEGLDAARAPALRARPQVRRDHPRQVAGELPGRRHDRAHPGQDAGRARRVPEHVRRGHARGLAGEPRGLRHRVRRSRRVDQHRDRRVPAAAARRHPGDAQPLGPATEPEQFVTELGDTAAIVAPAAETQASLFRNLDTTMAALKDVARPYIQDSITAASPRWTPASRALPEPAAVPGQHRRPDARVAARRPRAAHRRPGARGRAGAGIEVLPKTPPLNRRLESLLRRCRRSPTTRSSRADPGHDRARATRCPDAGLPRADPDGLQLHDAVLPQHLLAAERGRQERHLAAVHHRHHAGGPNNEGGPSSAARPTARRSTTTCTPTRTRTPPRRGSRVSASPATSGTCAGRDGDSATSRHAAGATEGYARETRN